MAAVPWIKGVRASKVLTVFAHSSTSASNWKAVLAAAIAEFNALSAKHALGVTLKETTTSAGADGAGGANIQFSAASGAVSLTIGTSTVTKPFSGTSLHGLTLLVKQASTKGGAEEISQAHIFVPNNPQGQNRAVGDGIKRFIAVHEFVHAVSGMENADHSGEKPGVADVFIGLPHATPQFNAGKTPAQDEIMVGTSPNFTRMPPIILSSTNATRIKSVW